MVPHVEGWAESGKYVSLCWTLNVPVLGPYMNVDTKAALLDFLPTFPHQTYTVDHFGKFKPPQ